ncbi:MAG: hypothetical protein FJ214_10400 [Ignavibacteria bacterium]|nr:hypothetical protein [Ignavibacteria bacterium]
MSPQRFAFILFGLLLLAKLNVAQDLKSKIDSVNSLTYEYIVSNTRQSIKVLSENLQQAREIEYIEGEAKALSNLGLAYYLRGNYESSTESYLSAIRLYENIKDYNMLAETYGEYGYQLKRRDMNKALLNMRLGISVAEKRNAEPIRKSKLYDNYGVLKEMKNELDSAEYFYKKALKIKNETNDLVGIPYSLNKMAGLKILRKNYSESLRYLKLSDAYRKKEEGDFGRAENQMLYAELYLRKGEIDSAISRYKSCLALSQKLGYSFLIQESYRNLAEIYKKKNEYYNAFSNFENFVIYKDSINNLEINSTIAQLEIDYETANKNKTIAENSLLIKQKNQTLYTLVAAGLFLVVAFVWFLRIQKLKNEKEKKELELNTLLTKTEMVKRLSEEKLRLSRELHDNIGSQLTFVISSLDNITYQDKENPIAEKLEKLSMFGRETLGDLRNTIWAIKQEAGDTSQLIYRLNELIINLNANMVSPKIFLLNTIETPLRLTSSRLLNIYRIIQEAIQNAIKHSQASEIKIEFNPLGKGFAMNIKDNGKGFDLENAPGGNGLENMKARCEESFGQFYIESNSSGTELKCLFDTN